MKIHDIILIRGAKIAREVRRIAKQSKQTIPLTAEKGGVIGDTVQIGKNVRNVSNTSFKSKWITKVEQKAITEKFSTKMKDRSEGVQELYQINIDFVNKKINKKRYLDELDCLLMNPKGVAWGNLDRGEEMFIGSYSTFFDFHGANVDCITKKNRLSKMVYLLPKLLLYFRKIRL